MKSFSFLLLGTLFFNVSNIHAINININNQYSNIPGDLSLFIEVQDKTSMDGEGEIIIKNISNLKSNSSFIMGDKFQPRLIQAGFSYKGSLNLAPENTCTIEGDGQYLFEKTIGQPIKDIYFTISQNPFDPSPSATPICKAKIIYGNDEAPAPAAQAPAPAAQAPAPAAQAPAPAAQAPAPVAQAPAPAAQAPAPAAQAPAPAAQAPAPAAQAPAPAAQAPALAAQASAPVAQASAPAAPVQQTSSSSSSSFFSSLFKK